MNSEEPRRETPDPLPPAQDVALTEADATTSSVFSGQSLIGPSALLPGSDAAERLQKPVQYVRGVGPRRAELLEKLGVRTAGDLLSLVPRDVIDLSTVTPVESLREKELQTVVGVVVDRDSRMTGQGRTMTGVVLRSEQHHVRGLWFNQPYMLHRFAEGQRVLFSGKPQFKQRRWEFSHPQVQWIGEEDDAVGGVWPVYGLTEGLRQAELRRMIGTAVEECAALIPDPLPEDFRVAQGWPHLSVALRQLHQPATLAEYEAARQRLIYDDLLEFQIGLALRRRAWQARARAPECVCTAKIDSRIRSRFPFAMTPGQNAAIAEIVQDLARSQPMHRLLQADVGAGKTAVALYAMLLVISQGAQVVLLAPTELLAQQHWRTVDRLLKGSRVKRVLLTGQLGTAERTAVVASIASGEAGLVIATQAVLQEDIRWSRLGLVVIDEQHKFGVQQRSHFSRGDDQRPHVLVMTATPIPRSLCLTQFGDLDLTVISDLPPGRQPVVTTLLAGPEARAASWQFIAGKLREGRQAFVVCPRIEAGDGIANAEEVFVELQRGVLAGLTVELVHGRQPRDERQATMDSFRDGEVSALVATTVVEVGVDVPNATIMVIYDAERFGLAQLHQLRGRVGRGSRQGYCFLLTDQEDEATLARLEAVVKTKDGFEIAELDFQFRGPGDVLGTRQHGDLPLRIADLTRDRELLLRARGDAFGLVATGLLDEPDYAVLKLLVLDRFTKLMDLPRSG